MILEGRSDQALMLAQLQRALPVSWDEQRRRLAVDGLYDRDDRLGCFRRSICAPPAS